MPFTKDVYAQDCEKEFLYPDPSRNWQIDKSNQSKLYFCCRTVEAKDQSKILPSAVYPLSFIGHWCKLSIYLRVNKDFTWYLDVNSVLVNLALFTLL